MTKYYVNQDSFYAADCDHVEEGTSVVTRAGEYVMEQEVVGQFSPSRALGYYESFTNNLVALMVRDGMLDWLVEHNFVRVTK